MRKEGIDFSGAGVEFVGGRGPWRGVAWHGVGVGVEVVIASWFCIVE